MSAAAELKERMGAELRGIPFLVFRDQSGAQVIHELSGALVTIGRRDDNDIALTWDRQVSRVHAQVEPIKGDWCLTDEGLSRNGSWVNGERVAGRRRLRDGDRLCVGATNIAYRAPASDFESTVGPPADLSPVTLTEIQRKILVALCRPLVESALASPAPNRAIAEEVFLSVDAVKAHLRVLFERFGLADLPQNEKRSRLAATALLNGTVKPHEL